MRALSTLNLGHFQVKERLETRYPNKSELITLFRGLPYAPVDTGHFGNEEKLSEYYREQSSPVFYHFFDDIIHQDLKKDLDYVIFYGEIASGARIVVSNRNEGQIKIRIWDPNLNQLLDGVEEFFWELYKIERSSKRIVGEGELFFSKEVSIRVLEKAEIDEVLEGSTVRFSPIKRFRRQNRTRLFVFSAFSGGVAIGHLEK